MMEEIKHPESMVDRKDSEDFGSSNSIYIEPEKEKAALRKFDLFLLPVAFMFLLLSSLDRSNIGNARVFGLDQDLGLVGGQFGTINTVFFVTFVLFETPWVMAVKRFGPNKTLGVALVAWSIVTIGTGFIHNFAQAIAVRLLLGACEAGVSPSFAYLFATIYPRTSSAKRIMIGNLCNTVAGAFGGLFAYAIQTMGERRGIAAWRWLFIIEGACTLFVGGFFWIFLPSSADSAWFLTAEEKETMQLRRQRNMTFRGEDEFKAKYVRLALKDPYIYVSGAAFFFSSVAITGFSIFLPTIIKGLGYASLQVNYLTIPVYVVGAISLVIQAHFSDKYEQRALFLVGSAVPVITGYLICVGTSNAVAGYVAMFILSMGVYSISTIIVTWVAGNLSPDYKRSVALPVFYSIGNLSGLVSSQLYPSQHAPRYVIGNATSSGLELVAASLFVAAWVLLRRRNAKKAKLIAEGATSNGKQGDMALDFKYCL